MDATMKQETAYQVFQDTLLPTWFHKNPAQHLSGFSIEGNTLVFNSKTLELTIPGWLFANYSKNDLLKSMENPDFDPLLDMPQDVRIQAITGPRIKFDPYAVSHHHIEVMQLPTIDLIDGVLSYEPGQMKHTVTLRNTRRDSLKRPSVQVSYEGLPTKRGRQFSYYTQPRTETGIALDFDELNALALGLKSLHEKTLLVEHDNIFVDAIKSLATFKTIDGLTVYKRINAHTQDSAITRLMLPFETLAEMKDFGKVTGDIKAIGHLSTKEQTAFVYQANDNSHRGSIVAIQDYELLNDVAQLPELGENPAFVLSLKELKKLVQAHKPVTGVKNDDKKSIVNALSIHNRSGMAGFYSSDGKQALLYTHKSNTEDFETVTVRLSEMNAIVHSLSKDDETPSDENVSFFIVDGKVYVETSLFTFGLSVIKPQTNVVETIERMVNAAKKNGAVTRFAFDNTAKKALKAASAALKRAEKEAKSVHATMTIDADKHTMQFAVDAVAYTGEKIACDTGTYAQISMNVKWFYDFYRLAKGGKQHTIATNGSHNPVMLNTENDSFECVALIMPVYVQNP